MIGFQHLDFAPLSRVYADTASYTDGALHADLASILREMHAERAAGRRSVSVVDLSRALPLSAVHRKLLLRWLKEVDALIPQISMGTVFARLLRWCAAC